MKIIISWLIFTYIIGIKLTYASDIIGIWQQIDDTSGQVHSLVNIETVAGETIGTLIKGYPVNGKPLELDQRCKNCPGDFKDKSLKNLRIMWGLRQNNNEWNDGQILDPDEGKIYNVKLQLSEDESKLIVRGYISISLLGRSQTWLRLKGGN